jgi:hypothetical protein
MRAARRVGHGVLGGRTLYELTAPEIICGFLVKHGPSALTTEHQLYGFMVQYRRNVTVQLCLAAISMT